MHILFINGFPQYVLSTGHWGPEVCYLFLTPLRIPYLRSPSLTWDMRVESCRWSGARHFILTPLGIPSLRYPPLFRDMRVECCIWIFSTYFLHNLLCPLSRGFWYSFSILIHSFPFLNKHWIWFPSFHLAIDMVSIQNYNVHHCTFPEKNL